MSQGDLKVMSEYLTKEEIRKWRSSLERITLEEYAAKLGKLIQEEKHDDSLVDSVMLKSLNSMSTEKYVQKTEKIQALALKSFSKEKEMKPLLKITEVESIENIQKNKAKLKKAKVKEEITEKVEETKKQNLKQIVEEEKIEYSFNKALTSREQVVFDHFLKHKNTIVYARDLAEILELPRDYVYKYIKNLRSKLNENILQNAENGGYMLKV